MMKVPSTALSITLILSTFAFGGCPVSSERFHQDSGRAQQSSNRDGSGETTRDARATESAPIKVSEINTNGLHELLGRSAQAKRPLLINFWATWCEPCREEFPDLVAIDREYRSRGLDFVTISLDDVSDIDRGVPQFLREMGATMPTYLLNVADPEMAISVVDQEWSGALPATFLFDAKGNLVYRRFGRIKPPELRAAIEKALNAKP